MVAAQQDEPSDDDNFSVHSFEGANNRLTVGIQTNEAHFRRITSSEEFER